MMHNNDQLDNHCKGTAPTENGPYNNPWALQLSSHIHNLLHQLPIVDLAKCSDRQWHCYTRHESNGASITMLLVRFHSVGSCWRHEPTLHVAHRPTAATMQWQSPAPRLHDDIPLANVNLSIIDQIEGAFSL